MQNRRGMAMQLAGMAPAAMVTQGWDPDMKRTMGALGGNSPTGRGMWNV